MRYQIWFLDVVMCVLKSNGFLFGSWYVDMLSTSTVFVLFEQLGEIHERFYRDWEKALSYYEWCSREDPERADSFFYIGPWL